MNYIPPYLVGVNLIEPPAEIITFCRVLNNKIEIMFIDDKVKCKNSVRYYSDIYINTRGTYWDSLIIPPWSLNHFSEAIVMKILHELGHIVSNHPGDPGLISTKEGLLINRTGDAWQSSLSGYEGEAWTFAFQIRKERNQEYKSLVDCILNWLPHHNFVDKDWDDDASDYWFKLYNRKLSDEFFNIPNWVFKQYKDFLDPQVKINII